MIVSFRHFIQIIGVRNFIWTYWDTKLIQIISYGPFNIILCSLYNVVYILCIKVAYNDDLFPEMFNKSAVSLDFLDSCLIWYWCSHCFKACFWYILNTTIHFMQVEQMVIFYDSCCIMHTLCSIKYEACLHYWEEYHTTLSFLYLQKSQGSHYSLDPILLA